MTRFKNKITPTLHKKPIIYIFLNKIKTTIRRQKCSSFENKSCFPNGAFVNALTVRVLKLSCPLGTIRSISIEMLRISNRIRFFVAYLIGSYWIVLMNISFNFLLTKNKYL